MMQSNKKPFAYGIKNKQKWFNYALALLAASILMVSCSKQDAVESGGLKANTLAATIPNTNTWVSITGPAGSGTVGDIKRSVTGDLYSIRNFKQNYTGAPGQPPAGNFYWSFANNEGDDATGYDIHFSGISTGDITSSTGTLRYINKAFASVVAADWSTANVPVANTIGMDAVTNDPGQPAAPPFVQAYANGKGWYNYHWTDHTVRPVAGRVLLYQNSASGIVYKFEIASIYQNSVIGGAFPYYTLQYQQL